MTPWLLESSTHHHLLLPILQVPNSKQQFVVEVDALAIGVGAVLSQEQPATPSMAYNHMLK